MSNSSHPDSNLHPTATGQAQETVSQHQTPTSLKLYAGWFCPFVQRAWLVLEEKKIPYQYIEVNPYHKPESLLSLNPRGLVPTLQYDEKPLYESTVICEFLDEVYVDHGPGLLPRDPYERARGRIWTDYCTSRIIPAFHRFLQFQPMSDGEGLEEARGEFLGHLKEFAKEMDPAGPFFAGKEISLIDIVVAPWAVSALCSFSSPCLGFSLLLPLLVPPPQKYESCSLISSQYNRSDSGSSTTGKVVLTSPRAGRTSKSGSASTNGLRLFETDRV